MNIVMRAARDCAGTVGSAYVAFSLYRLLAWPGHDFIVAAPEKYLGLTAIGIFVLLACAYSAAGWMKRGRWREQANASASLNKERGNVLFLILIAVSLFAALSYAVTRMGRTPGSTIEDEKAKLSQAQIDVYMAQINQGTNRLKLINKCKTIDYTPPADQGAEDKTCHMFHPYGGGVAYRDFGLDACALQGIDLTALAIGESACGVVYAGTSGGNRLYTTAADQGQISWNNGTGNWTVTGTTSTSDGLANTNTLVALADVGAPYNAANACRALGAEWYLPSQAELNVLYTNRAAIGGFNLSGSFPAGRYWSSSENGSIGARSQRFSDGNQNANGKSYGLSVRCVRR